MLLRRSEVRVTDWLLYAGIGFISIWAVRNTLFMAWWAR